MKKISISILSLLIFLLPISVFASTEVKERSVDNYLVPSHIQVTEQNKNQVLLTPAINANEKVYDFAELLTEEEEKEIYQSVNEFIRSANLDLGIVTIDKNNKFNAQEYAQDFYDYNDFGFDEVHSGILLLIDMDTREVYMSTTGEAITLYSDHRIQKIVDDISTYLTDKQYFKAIIKFVTIVDNYDKIGLPSTNDTKYVIGEDGTISKKIPWLFFILCPVIATIIVMGILIYKNKLVKKATSSREYLNKDSVDIKLESDQFLGSSVSKVPVSHSSSGGSSTSSGSSGVSHGGGGSKF